MSAKKEGYLFKQGGMIKSWKKRYFMLVGTVLSYSEKKGKKESGSVNIAAASEVKLAADCKKQPAFTIVTKQRTYLLVAPDKADAQNWVSILSEIVQQNNQENTAKATKPAAEKPHEKAASTPRGAKKSDAETKAAPPPRKAKKSDADAPAKAKEEHKGKHTHKKRSSRASSEYAEEKSKGSEQPSAPSAVPPPPAAPKKVHKEDFDYIRVLGKGTYGKVMLCRLKATGEYFAMKTLSKKLLEETEQVEQTLNERDVLIKSIHPFLVGAHYTFQTAEKIFMVLDYVPGGELFSRLKEEGKFDEPRAKLYAAEILLGLGHLHSLGYIYRDLKPENILVDKDGHLRLTDFGLVKPEMKYGSTTTTFCGTPEYIAPEMLQQLPYTKAVDWWSYGILVFEMMTGLPPFYDDNANKMYRMILQDPISYPSYMSPSAKDFIAKLLDRNPDTRLGSGPSDVEELKKHPFFASYNWEDIKNKKIKPQWQPPIKNETDTSQFDDEFTQEQAAVSFEDASLIDNMTQQEFQGFTMTKDSVLD